MALNIPNTQKHLVASSKPQSLQSQYRLEVPATGFAEVAAKFRQIVGPHRAETIQIIEGHKCLISSGGEILISQDIQGSLSIALPKEPRLLVENPDLYLMEVRLSDSGNVVMAIAESGEGSARRVQIIRSLTPEIIGQLKKILEEAGTCTFEACNLLGYQRKK